MAKKSGLGQSFYIGGYDLSGDVGAISSIGSPRTLLDITGINKSAIERVNGQGTGNLEFNTWFNDAALAEHVILSSLPTTDTSVVYAFGGAVGDTAALLTAKQVNYDWSRGADGSFQGTVQCQSTGYPLEWGVMLTAADDTHSSATSSSSKDDGASTASGIAGYLQIIDIASGTPTVKIQHSSNDSSWSDLVTFSAVANGAEPAFERKEASSTVNRYLRITTTGTFTDLDFVVAYRRGESTDDLAY